MGVNKIRALLIPVGEPARVVELDDALKGLQQAVGGFFELIVRFPCGPGRVADLLADEDATEKGVPENRVVRLPGFEAVVRGPMLVTASIAPGTDAADGETYSLTDDELAFCLRIVEQWPPATTEQPS